MDAHSQDHCGLCISYWRGNTAATPADADRVRIARGCYPSLEFALPAQGYDFEATRYALEIAATWGDKQARAEIRKALGVQ